MASNGILSAGLSATMGTEVIAGNSTGTFRACVSNSPVYPNLSLFAIHGFSLNYIVQPSSDQPTQMGNSQSESNDEDERLSEPFMSNLRWAKDKLIMFVFSQPFGI